MGHMDSFRVFHRMAFGRGCDRVNPLEADPATPHFLEPRLRRLLRPGLPTVLSEAPGSWTEVSTVLRRTESIQPVILRFEEAALPSHLALMPSDTAPALQPP